MPTKYRWLFVPVSLAVLALSGCGAWKATAYSTPSLKIPSQFPNASLVPVQAIVSRDPWWVAFGDQRLDHVVERVLSGNQQIAAALENIKAALQQEALVRAGSFPVLGMTGGVRKTRYFKSSAYSPSTTTSNSLEASVSYEVDLWGTLSSRTDAASWEARATEQDREALIQSLVGAAVDLYWQIAYLNRQLDLSNDAVAYSQHTLAIAQTKYALGAIPAIDRLAAEQSLGTQQADRITIIDQLTQANNALSLLMGNPPGEQFDIPAGRLDGPLPPVTPGIPIDVLARRPDLKAVEIRLREYLKNVDAARTSFYPTLTLTGSAGSSSQALKDLLQNPVGTLAAAVTMPFLNLWTMKATVGVAQATYNSAAATFRNTFYRALQDVDNALAARDHYTAEELQYAIVESAATQTMRHDEYAYQAGAIPLQTLLDAQQALRYIQQVRSIVRYHQFVNQVTLYQALGGNATVE